MIDYDVRASGDILCGLPLDAPTGGPCVTCGQAARLLWIPHGCEDVLRGLPCRAKSSNHHPYASPLGCSIHGAATDRGEA